MNHLETTYQAPDGISIYLQAWMPENPRAALLLVHGLGEHSGRYAELAKRLNSLGISVFTFDGRGHGKTASGNLDAYFESYLHYLDDIDVLLGKVKSYSPGLPVFLYGHSMGGGMAAAYVLKYQPELAGVVLSSPAIKEAEGTSKILIALSSFISKYFPKLKALKLDASKISRNPDEVEKYLNDDLVYSEAIPARTGYELLQVMRFIQKSGVHFDSPLLLIHGSADELTNPKGSELLFNKAKSTDKTIKIFPGGYHELINDLDKEKVFAVIEDWLRERI